VQGGAGGPGVVDAGLGVDGFMVVGFVVGSRSFTSESVAGKWQCEVSAWST